MGAHTRVTNITLTKHIKNSYNNMLRNKAVEFTLVIEPVSDKNKDVPTQGLKYPDNGNFYGPYYIYRESNYTRYGFITPYIFPIPFKNVLLGGSSITIHDINIYLPCSGPYTVKLIANYTVPKDYVDRSYKYLYVDDIPPNFTGGWYFKDNLLGTRVPDIDLEKGTVTISDTQEEVMYF